MKKIKVQCAACGELVEIEDRGFYWTMCDACFDEFEADLMKDYEEWRKTHNE